MLKNLKTITLFELLASAAVVVSVVLLFEYLPAIIRFLIAL
ncbi:hypothetical protein SAMN06297358_3572 [Pedobacter xixiisoli]|uniref:Uncharacterized protein n=1 Tax=Pedobacter xixiisoli TaxID=1476464 RepID=A0A286ADB6_9SPHI|nr:hypothetical protein [Pedobacter xixiisoli]SOD19865.1 hypothetical protein SAMN06297358_3572 [Pedobacter xixiisoli]